MFIKSSYIETQKCNAGPIYYQDATALAEMIRNREISPVEVLKVHLERIEKLNPSINAVVTISDSAIEMAKVAEKL